MRRLLTLLCAFLAGCACTAAGCLNEIRFHVPADLVAGTAYDVRVCINGQCHERTLEPPDANTAAIDGPVALWPLDDTVVVELGDSPESTTPDVRFAITDDNGQLLATLDGRIDLAEFRPNGPMCGPICWTADIGMEPASEP